MLSTQSLNHPDLPQAASELVANAHRLVAAGYFGHASRSLRLLIQDGAWRINKRGSIAQSLENLLPLVCALADEASPQVGDTDAMTKTRAAEWLSGEEDGYISQLAMVARIQQKPAGIGWSEQALSGVATLAEPARKVAYRAFLMDAEMVLKARLEKISDGTGFAGAFGEMFDELRKDMPGLAQSNLDAFFGGMSAAIRIDDAAEQVSDTAIGRLAVQGVTINSAYSYLEHFIFQAVAALRAKAKDELGATEALMWLVNSDDGLAFLPQLATCKEIALILQKGVLRHALGIDDDAVDTYLAQLKTREQHTPDESGADDAWQSKNYRAPPINYPKRIKAWTKAALSQGEFVELVQLGEPHSPMLAALLADESLSTKGASAAQISALETRLGNALPPSYKAFLAASDGLLVADQCFNFLPSADVRWFAQDNQLWIDAWHDEGEELDDERYFTYGDDQDCVWMRNRYLQTALQVSDTWDGDVVLLNSDVKFGEEWEAWLFGNKLPGAIRYRSFAELIEAQVFSRYDEYS
jgi:hypothetical protein